MDPALSRLIELLPPPEDVSGRGVDWGKVESEMELTLPGHFKELINAYGDSIWFDLCYICCPPDTAEPTDVYIESLQRLLNIVGEYGPLDEDGDLELQVYPDPGGLFPFMSSSDGIYYFWNTESTDSQQWPMVQWDLHTFETMPFSTLAELFLDTLDWMKENEPDRMWVRPRKNE